MSLLWEQDTVIAAVTCIVLERHFWFRKIHEPNELIMERATKKAIGGLAKFMSPKVK